LQVCFLGFLSWNPLNLEEIKHKLANCSYKSQLHSSYCLTYVIWSRNLRFTRKQSRDQTWSRRDGGLNHPQTKVQGPKLKRETL